MCQEETSVKTVGMIGLGIMGMPMSANLLKAGLSVVGYGGPRSHAEKAKALERLGGSGAGSPREVAERSDVVVLVLPSVAALDDVIGGQDGLTASRRADLMVVEAGTFPIEDKLRARDALATVGMTTLDCPISGTGAQAVTKDLSIYGSGDRAAYERCIPAFQGFGRSSYYLGEFGNGSRMKYVANLLVAIHNVSTAEAFVLGMKSGLDPALIYQVIADGAGNSRMFEVRGPLMVKGEYEPATMKVDIWQKDMKIIGDFATRLGVPTPLFAASALLYTAAMAQGRAKQDTASVCAILEEWARLERGKTAN
jgi:3-hydroxyisobutyrate dehydrogenase-like beta-hydroxyacid dehydrogenase